MKQERIVRRIYAFGDSFTDTGAGSPLDTGPTAIAFMATSLGIDLQPARVGRIDTDSSVNFASGGACSGYVMGMEFGPRRFGHGLVNQVNDFVGAVHAGTLAFRPDDTLAFVAIGLNDGHIPSDATLTNVLGSVSRLVAAGIVNIDIATLPLVIPDFVETSTRLNPVLEQAVALASLAHPQLSIRLSKWGAYFDEILTDWSRYGFVEPELPCAVGEVRLDRPLVLGGDPEQYCYVTQAHPSVGVHRLVGERLASIVSSA